MPNEGPYRAVAPPRRPRLSDSIADQVERLIVDGTLGPGHALPPERELAQKFGVSRPSVREALLRLEARGLIKVARGGSFEVTDTTGPTIIDPLVHLLHAHPAAEQDVLELRHGLEMMSATFAAVRATREDRARLRKAFDQLVRRRAEQDPMVDAQADAEFHLAIAETSHNVALIHVMHGLHNLLRSTMRHAWDLVHQQHTHRQQLQDQHKALLDAITSGDADAARHAAEVHVDFVREQVLGLAPPSRAARPDKAAAGKPRPAAAKKRTRAATARSHR